MTIDIEDLKRVSVKPGDRFVVKVNDILSVEASRRMVHYFAEALGAPVVILQRGESLSVVGPED